VTLAACLFLLGAATPFNLPDRRGDTPHRTTVYPCITPDSIIINIEKVEFDTQPEWTKWGYIAFYLYAEDTAFIAVRFNEEGWMIEARLYGAPISPKQLVRIHPDPCSAVGGEFMQLPSTVPSNGLSS